MTTITDFCTGCRCCEQICPQNAILMKPNIEGFLYPTIDTGRCNNCNLCLKTCPQNQATVFNEIKQVYAARTNDKTVLSKSASGGLAYTLAYEFINNGGVVFGCAFDENLWAIQKSAYIVEELNGFCGSKYVQSDTRTTYKEVKDLLTDHRDVLYIGTPCQIGGLRAYLDEKYSNLFTIDIVCHGVPSPRLFADYIKWLEVKYGEKIYDYSFRTKEKSGWGFSYVAKIVTSRGKYYLPGSLDFYISNFIEGNNLRESCYRCKYASHRRCSDITLGDYIGLESVHPKFYCSDGVSVVLVNTKKGLDILEAISNQIEKIESHYGLAAKKNKNLTEPSNRTSKRERFYEQLSKVSEKHRYKLQLTEIDRLKRIAKTLIPYKFKIMLRYLKIRIQYRE
jgi:coenzyme F420-reducing hydrogenase beta subunit